LEVNPERVVTVEERLERLVLRVLTVPEREERSD